MVHRHIPESKIPEVQSHKNVETSFTKNKLSKPEFNP